MKARRLVVVFNNIDERSAIGKLASWSVRVALEADFEVLAVAKDLDPSLETHVRHLPLHVPRAVFAYQWARALGTVKAALGSVSYDLLHTYQPQLTNLADTWHVQYLTRSAEQAGSLPRGKDPLARWRRSQLRVVALMEDRHIRRVSDRVNVLFPSELMRQEFSRLYGPPPRQMVLPNPAPAIVRLSVEQRRRARSELVGPFDGVVVGYLGGLDERKGWRDLVEGVAGASNCFLLFGGSGSSQFSDARLSGRCAQVGYVDDVTGFLAACDVLAVPSLFDPGPLVVTEAAARGVPSITTPMVGVQSEMLKHGAGVAWNGQAADFGAVINTVVENHAGLVAGAGRLAEDLSERRMGDQLLQVWLEGLDRWAKGQAPAST